MKKMMYMIAALALLATGYAVGVASMGTGQAGPLAQAGCQTFPETKKTVCGKFLQYWLAHGGVAQQGFPISAEMKERSDLNGQEYTVQYFERAVFELHPENQPPYDVLLSQLGTFRYREKYGSGGTQNPPPPPPAATPMPPAFVEIGDPVSRNGLVFTVTRLDRLAKRTDVIYTVKNISGGPMTFVLRNSDQRLLDDADRELQLADPSGVTTVTLQNGQEFTGGTNFNGAITEGDKATYIADNITAIGGVRVHIPLR